MLFALLAELIAIYMQITIIKVREPGLERLFAKLWVYILGYSGWYMSL